MNNQKTTTRAYIAPYMEICSMRFENSILATSPVEGGHHDAEDDGDALNAKSGNFFTEEGDF